MRQAVITKHGPPEVLQIRDAADPVPGARELRIRVRAAGVNFADVLARLGLYPDAPKPPLVAGYEVAGIVDAVGPDVAGFSPGDRVISVTRFGGYSEAVVVPVDHCFRVPPRLSDAEAAAVPVTYLTAAIALYRMAALNPGETVLIHNAGGGVGTAATQLALLRRATVIGTASALKHAALRSFGVEHLIDYTAGGNVADEVRRITHGRGADVILDPVGGTSFLESYRMLAPLGRLVMFGLSAAAQGEEKSWWRAFQAWRLTPRFDPLSMINRNRGIFGLHVGHLWTERSRLLPLMQMLLSELDAGRLSPVVARTFPLEKAADAHRFVQSRANIGKVVLTMTGR